MKIYSMKILCIILVLVGSSFAVHQLKVQSELNNEMFNYLHKFGYLPKQITNSKNVTATKEFKSGILLLQRNSNIPVTGHIDKETIDIMRRSRCGVSDSTLNIKRRHKRFSLLSTKWHRNDLNWHFDPKNPKFVDHTDSIRRLISKALAEWSGGSKLTFTEISSMDADIILSFEPRRHGDNNDFDGYGGTLAHAWPPAADIGGDVHFDGDEAWNFEETGNFYPIVLHELGHSFGLGHSNGKNDIMYEFYTRETLTLSRDDVQGIQHIYGKPKVDNEIDMSSSTTQNSITSEEIPNGCDTNYDAVAMIRNELLLFKGRYLWRFNKGKIMDGFPVPINRWWRDLPHDFTHVDAVFEQKDGKILFFIGRDVYVFNSTTLDRKMSLSYLGISRYVDKIDAIFTWGYNKMTYIFSGEIYWRFNQEKFLVDKYYPRQTSNTWRNVYDIDTAFQKDGTTYFFKDKSFYEFDDRTMRLRIMKPQSSAQHWMGCPPEPDRIIFDNRFQSSEVIDSIIDVGEEIFEDDIENVEKYADYVEVTTGKATTVNIISYPIIMISIILLSSR